MKRLIDILASGVTDDDGAPLTNGTVRFYLAGTTTLRTVYEDFELQEPHANPATLDEAGRLIAYSDQRLKLSISNSTGAVVRVIDNVGTADEDVIFSATVASLAGSGLEVEPDGQLAVRVDGDTLTNTGDVIAVADGGIDTEQLADNSVDGDKIADDVVIASSVKITSTGATLTGINTKTLGISDGTTVRSAVVSRTPATNGLMIVRGLVNTDGTIAVGEGFSVSKVSTGVFTITFTTAFQDQPVVTTANATTLFPAAYVAGICNTTTLSVVLVNSAGTAVDRAFNFIAIGQRA